MFNSTVLYLKNNTRINNLALSPYHNSSQEKSQDEVNKHSTEEHPESHKADPSDLEPEQ